MSKPQVRPTDLAGRFLQYLHEERAEVLREIKAGNEKAVEDRKRLRDIEREIETIKGSAF